MKIEHWSEVVQIKSIVFGADKPCEKIYVYLHGAGGFQTGYEGQYEYPDFPSLLRDGEIDPEQPFVIACCMDKERWESEQLITYLNEISSRFSNAEIDIIGYSRGGTGVHDLLQSGAALSSATVINARVPVVRALPQMPIHIIHAINDHVTSLEAVEEFVSQCGNAFTLLTPWQGDHFSIASIAKSGLWCRAGFVT